MSTRSACKCTLTGLSLCPDTIEIVANVGNFHRPLWRLWTEKYHTMMHDDSPVDDTNNIIIFNTLHGESLTSRQIQFAADTLDNIVHNCVNHELNESWANTDFLSAKILVGWLLILNPRIALEVCVRNIFALESNPVQDNSTGDILHTMFTTALTSMLVNISLNRMLTELDDIRINMNGPLSYRSLLNFAFNVL